FKPAAFQQSADFINRLSGKGNDFFGQVESYLIELLKDNDDYQHCIQTQRFKSARHAAKRQNGIGTPHFLRYNHALLNSECSAAR
ncbi:hypothetical protein, partial [Neisseria meningitidis]